MPCHYAGVAIALPTAEWQAWIDTYHPLPQTPPGFTHGWHGGGAMADLPLPPEPVPPPVRLGVLDWPVGASRWATFHFLAGSTQLAAIREAIGTAGVGDLVMGDGTDSDHEITAVGMRLGVPLPLHQIDATEQLFLCTLVDQRWDWWLKAGGIDTQPATWGALFADIEAELGVTITPATVNAAYGTPGDQWLQFVRPLPVLLDAAAESVGQRVVVRLDGTVATANPFDAVTDASVAFSFVRKTAGGEVVAADVGRWVPESVSVVVGRQDEAGGNTFESVGQVTLASLALANQYGAATGVAGNTVPVHRWFVGAAGDEAAFRRQVAQDWYLWQLSSVDATLPGVWDWTPTGAEDRVEWKYDNGPILTRILRRPFCELADGFVYWSSQPLVRVTAAGEDGTGEYTRRFSVQEVAIQEDGADRNLVDLDRQWSDVVERSNRSVSLSAAATPEEGVYTLRRAPSGHLYIDRDEGGETGFHARLVYGSGGGPWTVQEIARGAADWEDVGGPKSNAYAKAWNDGTTPNPQVDDIVWVKVSEEDATKYEFVSHPRFGCGIAHDEETDTYALDLTAAAFDGLYWDAENCVAGVLTGCGTTYGPTTVPGAEGDAIVVDFPVLAGEREDTALVVVEQGGGSGNCDSLGVDLEAASTTTEELVNDVALSLSSDGAAITVTLTLTKTVYTNHFNLAGLHIDRTAGYPSEEVLTESVTLDTSFLCDCCDAGDPSVEAGATDQGDCCFAFTATPAGGTPPYTFSWDFGDGTSSSDQNPTHCFEAEGTYEVVVTVTDACGKTATDSVVVECVFPIETPCCPDDPVPATLNWAITNITGNCSCILTTSGTVTYGTGFPSVWGLVEFSCLQQECEEDAEHYLQCVDGAWEYGGASTLVSAQCDPFQVVFDVAPPFGGTYRITFTG
jgi:hypothetical protein